MLLEDNETHSLFLALSTLRSFLQQRYSKFSSSEQHIQCFMKLRFPKPHLLNHIWEWGLRIFSAPLLQTFFLLFGMLKGLGPAGEILLATEARNNPSLRSKKALLWKGWERRVTEALSQGRLHGSRRKAPKMHLRRALQSRSQLLKAYKGA